MKYYIVTLLCVFSLLEASAQYVDQALKYSQQYYTGTARSQGMGNAFGALGGDFTSLSINPAGLGIYRSSEVVFSPTVMRLSDTETTYQGNNSDDSNYNFNFRNFGYVGSTKPNSSTIVNLNWGLGYNRQNNFNFDRLTSAKNSPHSRMDAFAQNTNGINYNDLVSESGYNPYDHVPWESELAWQGYLINVTDGSDDQYVSVLYEDEKVDQRETYTSEGAIDELMFSMGMNFLDKLYLGATLGVQTVYNKETRSYFENGDFGNFNYVNSTKTTGTGVNAKFGAIYRPVPSVRLGVALHTPTFYNLKESYYSDMYSYVEVEGSMKNTEEKSPYGNFDYNLQTPLRTVFSGAVMLGRVAMISVDYELVDYANAELSKGGGGYDFFNENGEISKVFSTTHNIRGGIEYRVSQNISLRGGYEYYDNPYNSTAYGVEQPNSKYSYNKGSLGIGYRNKNFFFDAAYSITKSTNYTYLYQVYDINDVPLVDATEINETVNELVFSIGFKF